MEALKKKIKKAKKYLEAEWDVTVTLVAGSDVNAVIKSLQKVDRKKVMDVSFLGKTGNEIEFFAADDGQLKDIQDLVKKIKGAKVKTKKA
jgi:hypothetical protein